MKKHHISLDFAKGRGGTGGVYMSPSSSSISVSSRSSASQTGTTGKPMRYPPVGHTAPPVPSSISKMNPGIGRHSGSAAGAVGGDKTICQYCGLSYLTIAELRALKATVKEQNERLLHQKEILSENNHLKEVVEESRQTHQNELTKYEEEVKRMKMRCRGLEEEIQFLKSPNKPEGLIHGHSKGENELIQEKMKLLESAIRKIVLNPQFKDKPETDVLITRLEEINRIIGQTLTSGMGDQSAQSTGTLIGNSPNNIQTPRMKRRSKSKLRTGSAIVGGGRKVSSLNAVEVHDLRKENFSLVEKIRTLSADFANSQEMHANLRETLDKLKIDNDNLHEEINTLRIQSEESHVTNENLEAQLKGFRSENERLRSFGKEMELRLRAADEQNRILKSSVDQKLVDRLQLTLAGLKKQIQEHQVQTEKVRSEFLQKLAEAQRETTMEKERADSCLAASLLERQEVERRWEERWGRHQASLTDQLESLRSNYEKTLASIKVHEEALQKEVNSLRDKYEKSKEAWEAYRKSLNDQVGNWKTKYEQKQNELEAAYQSKVEVELLYQEKSAEMESLHEIIREGCEERQELQRQVSEMKESFEEVRLQGQRNFPGNRKSPPMRNSLLGEASQEGGYCSFAELKEKVENLEPVTSGFMAPPPTCSSTGNKTVNPPESSYNPPSTAPILAPTVRARGGNSRKGKQVPTVVVDPHLFTIGKGSKQSTPTQPPSKANPLPAVAVTPIKSRKHKK